MADNLQTRHDRRLVHSYFHLWTDKTRQMQRAREFHDQTLLKRYANIWITPREVQNTWRKLLICPESSTLWLHFAKLISLSFSQIAGGMEESYQEKDWCKKHYKVISRSTDEQEGETKCPFLSPPNTNFDSTLSSVKHLCSLLIFEYSNDVGVGSLVVRASVITEWMRFLILTFPCDMMLSLIPGPTVWIFLHVLRFRPAGNHYFPLPIRSGIRDHLKIVKKHLWSMMLPCSCLREKLCFCHNLLLAVFMS